MARKNHAEHARVTAICVNLALDGVEADIRHELNGAPDFEARALLRILEKLKERRISADVLTPVGSC